MFDELRMDGERKRRLSTLRDREMARMGSSRLTDKIIDIASFDYPGYGEFLLDQYSAWEKVLAWFDQDSWQKIEPELRSIVDCLLVDHTELAERWMNGKLMEGTLASILGANLTQSSRFVSLVDNEAQRVEMRWERNELQAQVARYREQRETELGQYTDEQLGIVISRYAMQLNQLLSGDRFSMIVTIVDWEVETGARVEFFS